MFSNFILPVWAEIFYIACYRNIFFTCTMEIIVWAQLGFPLHGFGCSLYYIIEVLSERALENAKNYLDNILMEKYIYVVNGFKDVFTQACYLFHWSASTHISYLETKNRGSITFKNIPTLNPPLSNAKINY